MLENVYNYKFSKYNFDIQSQRMTTNRESWEYYLDTYLYLLEI